MKEYYLGIDIGTYESRGMLIDENMIPVADCSVTHGMDHPQEGWFEHDADKVWWGDFCKLCRLLLEKSNIRSDEIRCVGTSALGTDCLPVDKDCNPLRPAILYGIDSRAEEEIKWLTQYYGDDVKKMFGHPICTGDTATKILWLKNHEPEVYEKTYKFLTGSSYLTAKLTGKYVIDQFLAKGSFRPLYNRDGTINKENCSLYCRPDQIAECAYSFEIAGTVTEEAAKESGLKKGTPVIVGTGDSTAEAISVGLVESGTVFFQYGSSMFYYYCVDRYVDDYVSANGNGSLKGGKEFTIPGTFCIGDGTNAAGTLTRWVRDTFNNLAYGYYLVYQTGTKEIQSSLVSVDKDSKTITLKGKAPSIEKEADKTTVEIGQVVTYTITGTIPDTTGYAQYTYKIHDTLTEGLDFVEDTMGKLPTEKKYEVSVQIEGEQDSVIKEADIDPDNARKMTLDLSQWIRENQTHKGKTFTVTYYAKVNADAVVQTNNSAHLEYGNDPDNITTTTPDVVTTPTYPVQIHKLIKDQQNSYLAGAIFRLYRSEEDANNNQNAIAVTGSNGTYTVDPVQVGDNKMYDMESIGDGTTVGTGMNLKLNGLAEGSYWLVETQAPDGYNKLTAPVKITITKSDTTNVDDWTIKQNDGVVDDKIIDIENTTGTLLPETGGMGTVIFTVIAVVMILGIAVSFVISRRKRA